MEQKECRWNNMEQKKCRWNKKIVDGTKRLLMEQKECRWNKKSVNGKKECRWNKKSVNKSHNALLKPILTNEINLKTIELIAKID